MTPITYQVRIYCYTSFGRGTCDHDPPHPFTLPGSFGTIRAANDAGEEFIAKVKNDEVEWEVVDSSGETVC